MLFAVILDLSPTNVSWELLYLLLIWLSNVDLPEPDGPRIARSSPGLASPLQFRRIYRYSLFPILRSTTCFSSSHGTQTLRFFHWRVIAVVFSNYSDTSLLESDNYSELLVDCESVLLDTFEILGAMRLFLTVIF